MAKKKLKGKKTKRRAKTKPPAPSAPPPEREARPPWSLDVVAEKVNAIAKEKCAAEVDFACARKLDEKAPNEALRVLRKLAQVVRDYIHYCEVDGSIYGQEAFDRLADHRLVPYAENTLRSFANYAELTDETIEDQIKRGLPERQALGKASGLLRESRKQSKAKDKGHLEGF